MMPEREYERWLRRQAFHVASLLPDDTDAAQRILCLAQELVGSFLMGEPERPVRPRPVALKLVTRDGVPTVEIDPQTQEQEGSLPSDRQGSGGGNEDPPYRSSPR